MLEQTVSSTVLLDWLACTSSQRGLYGPGAFVALQKFCTKLLCEDMELEIPLDEEYANGFIFPGTRCNPELCAKIPVDSNYIWLQPFLDQAEGSEFMMLQGFFAHWTHLVMSPMARLTWLGFLWSCPMSVVYSGCFVCWSFP